MTQTDYSNLTVVLVHAAWADGSSWNKVIRPLQHLGFRVRSAQLPLTALTDDVTAVDRLLRQVQKTVLLAGHSYGGAAITAAATANPHVKALVYIAAMAPDEGETVGALFHREAPHPSAPQLSPDADGFLWLPPEAFANAVAPDATPEETALMAATQRPITVQCLEEPLAAPAWKRSPSWFLIAEKDRMLSPVTQRFMAKRTGARIYSLEVDHTPLVSAPEAVTRLIVEAADAIV